MTPVRGIPLAETGLTDHPWYRFHTIGPTAIQSRFLPNGSIAVLGGNKPTALGDVNMRWKYKDGFLEIYSPRGLAGKYVYRGDIFSSETSAPHHHYWVPDLRITYTNQAAAPKASPARSKR